MKGLLYKDFAAILTAYRKNALLVIVVYSFAAFAADSVYLLYSIPILTGLYALGSLSFDEVSHWDTYARTLPVTLGQIVGAKYLLGCIWVSIGFATSLLLTTIYGLVTASAVEEAPVACAACAAVALLYFAVAFPLSYKMGPTQARSGILILTVALFGGVYLLSRLPIFAGGFPFTLSDAALSRADWLFSAGLPWLALGCIAIVLALYAISWRISVAIYARQSL